MDQKGGKNYETRFFSQEQLAEIGKDPKNKVYKFENERIESDTVGNTLEEIRGLVLRIRARFLEVKKNSPDCTDDQIRKQLCSEKPRWRQFSNTHLKIFENITDSKTTEEIMKHHIYAMEVAHKLEKGEITHEYAKASITQYYTNVFKKDNASSKIK